MSKKSEPGLDIVVCTKLNEKLVTSVDQWAERSWRDRSKILSAILTTVLNMVEHDNNFEHDLDGVIRRLYLESA